jgi:hypothetical protein
VAKAESYCNIVFDNQRVKAGNIRSIKKGGRRKEGEGWKFWHSVKKKIVSTLVGAGTERAAL